MLNREEAISQMNELGAQGVPFLFFTDFEGNEVFVKPFSDLSTDEVSFDFNGIFNSEVSILKGNMTLIKSPIRLETFDLAFQKVIAEIKYGNSFLTNLTFETPIELSGSLKNVFDSVGAKYKLLFEDRFVCFSPEIFVQIKGNQIRSNPMKGTIDAAIPNAEMKILNDQKEAAEHVTIVDLIRNDLSRVAKNVRVNRFRYIDRLETAAGALLQVSSEIVGDLDEKWQGSLGSILFSMLPAGSICGAPKPKTVDIIKSVESHDRGFYTGVCGVFDGIKFDSGVMIRFIERRTDHFFYKSGGGITAFSELEKEYQEYQDKIYIPIR